MKMSSLALAAVLALGAGAAHAAGGALDLSTGSVGFSSTPSFLGFTDVWTFLLPSSGTLSGSVVTGPTVGGFDIDFGVITLTGPSGFYSFTKLMSDPLPEVWTLSPTALSAGSYTLTLVGSNTSTQASYGGNLSVVAVPEPETYAMLLAGLGVMGFVARRRRE